MDWQYAIDRNREKLLVIVMELMKRLGFLTGENVSTLPYYIYRKGLLILRPAEAAVRRLIMMAAYHMELRGIKLAKPRAKTTTPATSFPSTATFAPSFNLIDPLKPYAPEPPDYSGFRPPFDDQIGAFDRTPTSTASLHRRLLALKHALETVDAQARRLTRWYAVQQLAHQQNRPCRTSPLRPGLPPGYRAKPVHEVDAVLLDCHFFAQRARARRDSS
jgi:hypothetical protein